MGGAAIGFVAGLLGLGGGVFLVPLLTKVLRTEQHQAHATSLTIIIFIALSGMFFYITRGDVNWILVAEIAAGSIGGVFLGSRLMVRATSRNLRLGFGAFLIFSALWMISKPFI